MGHSYDPDHRGDGIEGVDRQDSVLLLASPKEEASTRACSTLLRMGSPSETALLLIDLEGEPDETLKAVRTRMEAPPADCTLVSVGELSRSADPTSHRIGDAIPDTVVEVVPDPKDLTTIGVKITDTLQRWAGSDMRPMACFDSLTTLLQHVNEKPAYKFCQVLTNQLRQADGSIHIHMDPNAHDTATVNLFKSVVDAVIEFTEDGEWIVRTR